MLSEQSNVSTLKFFDANGLRRPSKSERRVLGTSVRSSVIEHRALAKATGLAQQSISRLVKSLSSMGAVTEGERVLSGRRRQPGASVRVVPEFAYCVGVAIMTDAISVAGLDFSGRVIETQSVKLPAMTQTIVLDTVDQIVNRMVASTALRHSESLVWALASPAGTSARARSTTRRPRWPSGR